MTENVKVAGNTRVLRETRIVKPISPEATDLRVRGWTTLWNG